MFTKPKITKILFATDLSENANQAFNYATSLAEAYGAVITVLHVVEKMRPNAELLLAALLGYRDIDELRQKREADLIQEIKQCIEQFCAQAADQVPECRFILGQVIVEPGKAADRILHHISTGAYDALVIGSRGHGPVQEALVGGTAHKVFYKIRIPVFVVPLLQA
jgi:nucleotide-binding universal stress UspA family protein